MRRLSLLTLLFFGSSLCNAPHTLCIIVHGTWAHNETWGQPGGDFFENVRETAPRSTKIFSFSWNGKNSHAERVKAAVRLVAYLESLPLSMQVTIIAHSHGGNVAFLASQKLVHNHIDQLFALGTPIDRVHCHPNMTAIGAVYNLFSFGDPVQTVSGYFERVLPAHPRCTNVRLMLNGTNPNHAQIHSPLVALWLAEFPRLIAQANNPTSFISSSKLFSSETEELRRALFLRHKEKGDTEMPPFVMFELFDSAQPYCSTDSTLPQLLENEKQLYALLAAQMLPRTKRQNYLAV